MATDAAAILEPSALRQTAQGRTNVPPAGADSAEDRIIPTASLFDAVGVVLDLSIEGRDLLGAYASLAPDQRNAFGKVLSSFMERGFVGTETLDMSGKPYTTEAVSRLGDTRLLHANPYRPRTTGNKTHMDVLA